MYAFVEWLCEHALIVRAGPDALNHGDPFIASVTAKVEGSRAHLKGVAGSMSTALARAIIAAVNREGLTCEWDRLGDDPYRLIQSLEGANGGQIKMSKHPKVGHEKKNAHGETDQNDVLAGALHFITLLAAGKCKIEPVSEGDSPHRKGWTRLVFDRSPIEE